MRRIAVKRLDGATVLYDLPTRDAIQANFVETEATIFDPYERGPVSGGIPLPCELAAIYPPSAPRVSPLARSQASSSDNERLSLIVAIRNNS